MPKLVTRPPQYKQCGKYAVVYFDGKRVFLGLHGSEESKVAYARVLAEWASPVLVPPREEANVTVRKKGNVTAAGKVGERRYDTTTDQNIRGYGRTGMGARRTTQRTGSETVERTERETYERLTTDISVLARFGINPAARCPKAASRSFRQRMPLSVA